MNLYVTKVFSKLCKYLAKVYGQECGGRFCLQKKLGSGHWLVYGVTVYITELAIQPKSNSAR